jgi:5-methylcytosine-specific restriction endonuclease McrA
MNTFVFVLNKHNKPLMPTNPRKARILLKQGKARVVSKTPFTIKLLISSDGYKQDVIASMDTGSKTIGSSAITISTNNIVKVLYQAEIQLRSDISSKMEQRAMYRRNRRSRKTRYRAPRFLNRKSSTKSNRLAPSIKSKINSHLREKAFIESILPVSKWLVETASFDIHRITNPEVSGKGYQNGVMKDFYNVKQYILHRDNYKCQNTTKVNNQPIIHSKKLHVHHIMFKSNGGTDSPENLITLCETCHDNLHQGLFNLAKKGKQSKTKHATEIGMVKSQLKKQWINNSSNTISTSETFGYETKYTREQYLNLPKTHANDAIAIACNSLNSVGNNIKLVPNNTTYYKKHVCKGDYQQTSGARSEKKIPTGKLFGLRKFDLIKTEKGTGFVKGKRSTGYFVIMDIHGQIIHNSVNIKKNCKRINARKTTLIQRTHL